MTNFVQGKIVNSISVVIASSTVLNGQNIFSFITFNINLYLFPSIFRWSNISHFYRIKVHRKGLILEIHACPCMVLKLKIVLASFIDLYFLLIVLTSLRSIEFQKLGTWKLPIVKADLELVAFVGCPARNGVEKFEPAPLNWWFKASITYVVGTSVKFIEFALLPKG